MNYATSAAACLLVCALAALPVQAQGRGNGQAKKSSTTVARSGAKAKADTGSKASVSGPSKAKAPKNVKAPTTETQAAKANHPKHTKTAATTTTTLVPAVLTPSTPITQHVKNPKLEARLLTLLPPGATIVDASQGFRNWGQFVAAVHVSNNLGIPFADLKARMTGLTPGPVPGTTIQTTPMSLGQAIQSFKVVAPTAPIAVTTDPTLTQSKIKSEVKKAEDAATADLRRTRERS